MNNKNVSVGVFIDGGYWAKINEALEDQLSMNIRLSSFLKFVCEKISELHDIPVKNCFITENHYFRGRYRVNDANSKHLLYAERKFEDELIENDVIFHYKHLREIQKNGGTTVIEKGIDVWFALEAYELSTFRDFDFVVLITGDADHEMLVKKLKAIKKDVILINWNLSEQSSTSRLLREEACTHIEMSDLAAEDKEFVKKICKTV